MDSKVAAELIAPVYEDFDPSSEMVHEKEFDTILLNLPGFRKDHLKVQLTTSKILRISGSRLVEGNKWRRFQKEFPVTPGRDPQRITAKFEGGILYVKVPMSIPTLGKKSEDNKKSLVPTSPEKQPADQQLPFDHTDDKSAIAKEEPKEEKKAEMSPEQDNQEEQEKANKKSSEEKTSGLDDTKPEQEEKPRGLVEEMKRGGDGDDESKEDIEKREKESPETMDHESDDKTRDENQNDASKVLKKHRSIFNIVLVAMLAIAVGLYVTDLFKFLRRIKY